MPVHRRVHAVALICLLAISLLGARRCGGGEIYLASKGSQLLEGCFGMCECPVWIQGELSGFFRLRPLPIAAPSLYDEYAVDDLVFVARGAAKEIRISGSGLYRVGGEFALMQQMELDLSFDGGPPEHFDSGLVVGGSEFPALAVTLSQHGMQCYDRVIELAAKPLGRS